MDDMYRHQPLKVIDIASEMSGYTDPKDVKGDPPKVELVPVGELYLDHSYQREIRAAGRNNIRQIVAGFDWRHYQPLLVSRKEDGGYTVIDGQHRALAACLHPQIAHVPCSIVDADFQEQAKVFLEVNTQVVKMQPLEMFWAEYHAQRQWALDAVEIIHSADMFVAKTMPSDTQGVFGRVNNDQYDKFVEKFTYAIWTPKRVYQLSERIGYVPVLTALSFLRDVPDDPMVPNSYMLTAFAMAFSERNITDFRAELPDTFAQAFAFADIQEEVGRQNKTSIRRVRPSLIAKNTFVDPFLDKHLSTVARIEAA